MRIPVSGMKAAKAAEYRERLIFVMKYCRPICRFVRPAQDALAPTAAASGA